MFRYLFYFVFFFFFVCLQSAYAFVVKDVVVEGLKKFDPELIKSTIDIKVGQNISNSDLDGVVKKLYEMNIFSKIDVENRNGVLHFFVVENAVINEIFFEGNKELSKENILKELTIKPKSMYSKSSLKMNASKLIDMYRSIGYLSAKVNPKTIIRNSGKIDIVFEITEGKKAYVKEIKFVGNESFSKSDLIKAIRTKEYSWWKIFAQFDIFDENMIKYDVELLKKFYNQNAYLDFKIQPPVVRSSIDKSSFYIVFNFEEGQKYRIGQINISSDIKDINIESLYNELVIKNGYYCYGELINLSIKKLTDKLGELGYAFIQIDPDMKINKDNSTADVTFLIKQGKKVYVNNINIIGNVRTLDTVIRREMEIKEQDAYNVLSLKNSEYKLRRLQYFKDVKFKLNPDSNYRDKVNLDVEVEENSTGELFASLGWSSLNGLVVELGIKENNFRGKGQKVGITISRSDLQKRVMFSFTEPYFMDHDLSAGFDISYTRYDYNKDYGYNVDSFRLGGRLGWTWTQTLYQTVGISLQGDLYSDISPSLKDSVTAGFVPTSKIYQSLSWVDSSPDYFNNNVWEYSASLSNELSAGFSRDKFFKTDIEMKTNYTFLDNRITFGVMANMGHIESFDKSLSRVYRYFLGGENLRGFATAGAGSRLSRAYSAGGNSILFGNAQFSFPIGFSKEYNISGFLFYDFGWIAPPDDKGARYLNFTIRRYRFVDESFRTSAGFGIFWHSPMGPIKLTWGYPIKYKSYDELERFRFSISTLF